MIVSALVNIVNIYISQAQKQIYNLMKFDSYSRFLKSDVYENYLTKERKGLPMMNGGLDPELSLSTEALTNKASLIKAIQVIATEIYYNM